MRPRFLAPLSLTLLAACAAGPVRVVTTVWLVSTVAPWAACTVEA